MPDLWREEWKILEKKLLDRGLDTGSIRRRVAAFRCETPSWGYGPSGTRFGVFPQPGEARTIWEKLEDAAECHRLTQVCPSVAIHIPWDKVDDYDKMKAFAAERGMRIGAVNPNVFQDHDYKYGSFGHSDAKVRQKARAHMQECCQIMKAVGSAILSLWFADGTDYAGQADFRQRKRRFEEELQATYAMLPGGARMLIEYKFFEPAFYHTDIADWGMALNFAQKCGERAQVLVDLGHHAHGVNIEHLVAFLIDEGRLGGFHFNNRKYADDDLTCGSTNPYELFLIFVELTAAEAEQGTLTQPIAYMIDQSHNSKAKLEAMIQTVENIQIAQAKALCVDHKTLKECQGRNDVVGAERCLLDAFHADVLPLLKCVREESGAALEPLEAFRLSAYAEKAAAQRKGKVAGAGLGVN